MLVSPETITLPLIIAGNLLAILSGLFWSWRTIKIAEKTRQPKPNHIQSLVKILACICGFWTFYYISITDWSVVI